MKKLSILIIIVITAFTSCDKREIEEETPKCIENKIEDFIKSLSCDDANVKAYTFQSKTVYLFDAGTCGRDMASEVIDSDCCSLGHLGGFVGNTKINGEEFSNARFIKTIWQK
jgi:hypothetical protein